MLQNALVNVSNGRLELEFQSFWKRPFTTQNMKSEMAMDLCIHEKDDERESEVQSDVKAKKRARPFHPVPPGVYVIYKTFPQACFESAKKN